MVVVGCTVPGCAFETGDVSEALAIALLTNHGLVHRNPPAQIPTTHGPKLDRPKVDVGVTIEEWNFFIRRWDVFRTGSGVGAAHAPFQLFQCAGPELGDSMLKANPNITSGPLVDLIAAIRLPRVSCAPSCFSCTRSVMKHCVPSPPGWEGRRRHAPTLRYASVARMWSV